MNIPLPAALPALFLANGPTLPLVDPGALLWGAVRVSARKNVLVADPGDERLAGLPVMDEELLSSPICETLGE